MKTPAEIAEEVADRFGLNQARKDAYDAALAAVEIDRAQRAVVTPGHSADDIADEAAGSLGIDYDAYRPTREQVFTMCYEAASLAIDAVRASVAAQSEKEATDDHDDTVHAAVIAALKDRDEDDSAPGARLGIEWIENDPDGFWAEFGGPMLDEIERKFA